MLQQQMQQQMQQQVYQQQQQLIQKNVPEDNKKIETIMDDIVNKSKPIESKTTESKTTEPKPEAINNILDKIVSN